MLSVLGWLLAGTALVIMYAAKNGRSQLLNSQGKLAGLLIVIAVVGVLMLFGNYNKVQVIISFYNGSLVPKDYMRVSCCRTPSGELLL